MIFHFDPRALTAKVDGDHFVAVTNRCALTFRLPRQQMIEARARDLIGRAPAERMLFAEIELGVLFAAAERRAVFELKPAFFDGAQHARLF